MLLARPGRPVAADLAVIDGARALRRAVLDVFGHPIIQRCQLHVRRGAEPVGRLNAHGFPVQCCGHQRPAVGARHHTAGQRCDTARDLRRGSIRVGCDISSIQQAPGGVAAGARWPLGRIGDVKAEFGAKISHAKG
jgi:hypothetical protein